MLTKCVFENLLCFVHRIDNADEDCDDGKVRGQQGESGKKIRAWNCLNCIQCFGVEYVHAICQNKKYYGGWTITTPEIMNIPFALLYYHCAYVAFPCFSF